MLELRCRAKKHGEAVDDHTVEVKCSSVFCGAGPGKVVIHRFDLRSGEVSTNVYREAPNERRSE